MTCVSSWLQFRGIQVRREAIYIECQESKVVIRKRVVMTMNLKIVEILILF